MRQGIACLAVLTALASGSAAARVETVPTVLNANAGYSRAERHTIVVRAKVELPSTCWSNPRLKPMVAGDFPEKTVGFSVLADVVVRPGTECGFVVRPMCTPVFHWTTYPAKIERIHVVGTKKPFDTDIKRTGFGRCPR